MSIWTMKAEGDRGQAPDLAEVRRALSVLVDPEHGFQLQAAPSWDFRTFRAEDIEAAADWVSEHRAATGVYYALNPVPPNLSTRLKVPDPVRRRWLLVDVDRHKTSENKDLSATDSEHEQARGLALDVLSHLDRLGWPSPLLVDSGNGFHLLYRIDLPNDRFSQKLLRAVLLALDGLFTGDRGAIGKECHDARRIAKLPGTWARRGPASPDRPHRMCRLLHCPEHPEIVPLELLQQTAGLVSEGATEDTLSSCAAETPFNLRAHSGAGETAWARAALERECGRMALSGPGDLNNQLYRSGAALGNLVGAGLLTEEEVFESLLRAARQAGCDNPHKDEDTLRRAIEEGKSTPRVAPQPNGPPPPRADPPADLPEVIIYRASEVTPKAVEWLWPARIPLGKLTTFAGVGGLGKTFVLCDITARVTRGLDWPDSCGECCEPGQVLFISGEDDPDDTLVPRLIEQGAALDRVAFLKAAVQDNFTLAAVKVLSAAIDQMGPDTRLVVIDPPSSYLGGVNDHKNAELRALLSPLKTWAAQNRVAMIFNTHLNKPPSGKAEAMMRVMGSVAWVNAVRAAHLFARDPEDPSRRLFVGMKISNGRERKGLAYRIAETDSLARVEWLGEVDTTADNALNGAPRTPRAASASEWLIERFREKREWPSDDLFSAGAAEDVSRSAIFEAKRLLDLPRARKVGDRWIWWVPDDWPPLGRQCSDVHEGEEGQGSEEVFRESF